MQISKYKRKLFIIIYTVVFALTLIAMIINGVSVSATIIFAGILLWLVVATSVSLLSWLVIKPALSQIYGKDGETVSEDSVEEKPKELSISYELSYSDYIAFQISYGVNSPQYIRRRTILRRLILFADIIFIAVAICVILFFNSNQIILTCAVCILALSLLLFLVWLLFSPLFMHKLALHIAGKMLKKSNYKQIGKHTIVINDDRIKDITETGESVTNWGKVKGISSDDQYMVIIIRLPENITIPRTAFPDDLSFKQFIDATKAFHTLTKLNKRQ